MLSVLILFFFSMSPVDTGCYNEIALPEICSVLMGNHKLSNFICKRLLVVFFSFFFKLLFLIYLKQ